MNTHTCILVHLYICVVCVIVRLSSHSCRSIKWHVYVCMYIEACLWQVVIFVLQLTHRSSSCQFTYIITTPLANKLKVLVKGLCNVLCGFSSWLKFSCLVSSLLSLRLNFIVLHYITAENNPRNYVSIK